VIGMVVAAEKDARVRAAFIIPSDLLFEVFPELGNIFHSDMLIRWHEWEKRVCAEITYRDLGNRIDVVPSPLLKSWQEFIQCPGWHEKLAENLRYIRDLASNFHEFKKIIEVIN